MLSVVVEKIVKVFVSVVAVAVVEVGIIFGAFTVVVVVADFTVVALKVVIVFEAVAFVVDVAVKQVLVFDIVDVINFDLFLVFLLLDLTHKKRIKSKSPLIKSYSTTLFDDTKKFHRKC